jgi:prepilin-type N-terminal cleavage/methylation domain-containing protein
MTAVARPLRVPGRRRRQASGFTLLELLVAMGIFSVLGTMAVWFMRESLNIFYGGTRESAVYDRLDSALPRIRADLEAIYVGDRFSPPPPQPTDAQVLNGVKRLPPPPPPAVQLRSGYVTMRDVGEGPLKDLPCFYMAFVVALGNEWADPQLRRAGESVGRDPKPYTPATVEALSNEITFRPASGLMEVLWIAVAEDPDHPETLTLYRGFRTPVGDPAATLLDPTHFDSLAEVRTVARPIMTGVLHFGALWRRSFATDWNETGPIALGDETAPYVGPEWDSTRGFDRAFALHVGETSRGDPSDDIFPAFVRLELTLQGEGTFGFTRGDVLLTKPVAADDYLIYPAEVDSFFSLSLGTGSLWLKVGTEWMSYDRTSIDVASRSIRVQRGKRDTKAQAHGAPAWVHLGTPVQTELRLTFRDRFAVRRPGR